MLIYSLMFLNFLPPYHQSVFFVCMHFYISRYSSFIRIGYSFPALIDHHNVFRYVYSVSFLCMPEMAHDWLNKSILFCSILFRNDNSHILRLGKMLWKT